MWKRFSSSSKDGALGGRGRGVVVMYLLCVGLPSCPWDRLEEGIFCLPDSKNGSAKLFDFGEGVTQEDLEL